MKAPGQGSPGPASLKAFARAQELFPGGVNSPVRAFRSVGGSPLVLSKGKGPWVTDLDGRRYLDLVQSWGAHILGHTPRMVVKALSRQIRRGTSFGAPTAEENLLAGLIKDALPSLEKLRFVSSGTEAVMSALRVARGFTGRPLILKFDGCYHGHSDALLVQAGSGLATQGLPDSAGVPAAWTASTLSVPFNDLEAVAQTFQTHKGQIAAVIVEPQPANMGVVPPAPGFLQGLRSLCTTHGTLLIFDEVISGFRLSLGGAQQRFGITPDLTTLGKIIGGGLPAAAYGGKKEVMDLLAPLGPVYQAGTLSGNPAAMTAGAAVVKKLFQPGFYTNLEEKAQEFYARLGAALPGDVCLQTAGSLFTLFFCPGPVTNYSQARQADLAAFARWHGRLLAQGFSLAPSQFEANFIGAAHRPRDLHRLARAAALVPPTPGRPWSPEG